MVIPDGQVDFEIVKAWQQPLQVAVDHGQRDPGWRRWNVANTSGTNVAKVVAVALPVELDPVETLDRWQLAKL